MKKFLSISLIVISLCSIFLFGFTTKVNAASLGWEKRPISVYASTKLSSMEVSQLKEAINAWNSTKFGTFFEYKGQITELQIATFPNIVAVSKGAFAPAEDGDPSDALARTSWPKEGYVTKATIVINTNYTFNNGSTSSGEYYLKSVLMHELFHALGFKEHSIFSNSFFYKAYNGRTTFLNTDLEKLSTLY